MTEELDPFPFFLAEAMHMTLETLDNMRESEYLAWRAFWKWRNAMEEMKQ